MRGIIFDKIPIDNYSLNEISSLVENGERYFQIFLNVHKVVMMTKQPNPFSLIKQDECLYSVDGLWIKWVANKVGFYPKQRFGGLDVIEEFCQLSIKNDMKIYLLGSKSEVIEKVISNIKLKLPSINICGYNHGYFEDEELIIKNIIDLSPDLLFIALPSPRKELFGYKIFKRCITIKYAAGVGGAFDIIAGNSPRAPIFIQKLGIEWLYRVVLSPKRLFLRYFNDGLSFLKLILFDKKTD